MTLDDAIEHAKEISKLMGRQCGNKSFSCSMEHLQLANWLQQLRTIDSIVDDGTMTDETKIGHIRNVLDGKFEAGNH